MTMMTHREGKIRFIQFHQPALTAGEYTLTMSQTIEERSIPPSANGPAPPESIPTDQKYQAKAHFTVQGPRFALAPDEIQAVFPPHDSVGDHANVLPHITLKRSTLPWERTADGTANSQLPWLVLLLFPEDKAPEPKIMTLTDLREPVTTDHVCWPGLSPETGERDDQQVTVIDVSRNVMEKIMPTKGELAYMAHVRQFLVDDDTLTRDETAIVVGHQLPVSEGVSVVHLVSVENRYGTDHPEFNYQQVCQGQDDVIRLISLKSWRFACTSHQHGFAGLLYNLDSGSLHRPVTGKDQDGDQFLSAGYTPLHHFLRHGSRTVSWYRGPLLPGSKSDTSPSLPADAADALLYYDDSIGMLDVSYAAAWELGRLLILKSQTIALDLFHWKKAYRQLELAGEQALLHPHMFSTAVMQGLKVPNAVRTWFEALGRLQHVPFNYLVPDERMLPKESIRFFCVDSNWINCLLDGAFSVGRMSRDTHQQDQHHADAADHVAVRADDQLAGFLMRSEVVSGWPDLIIEAYDEREEDPQLIPDKDHLLNIVRREYLAPGILLCLFTLKQGKQLEMVDIHLKPEALHFGLKPENGGFTKLLKNVDGKVIDDPMWLIDDPQDGRFYWKDQALRVLDIERLAKQMHTELDGVFSDFTAAEFALQMLEGVERVRFLLRANS